MIGRIWVWLAGLWVVGCGLWLCSVLFGLVRRCGREEIDLDLFGGI